MEKTVKLGHLIVALLALMGTAFGAWINVKERQSVSDTKDIRFEQEIMEIKNTQKLNEAAQYTRHYELMKAVQDLRIIVENKQNRQ